MNYPFNTETSINNPLGINSDLTYQQIKQGRVFFTGFVSTPDCIYLEDKFVFVYVCVCWGRGSVCKALKGCGEAS